MRESTGQRDLTLQHLACKTKPTCVLPVGEGPARPPWCLLLERPAMSTLTQCCLPPGDVQLLAVVFERNAILRGGKRQLLVREPAGPQGAPF